jgi:small subunit ribosomal protein S1
VNPWEDFASGYKKGDHVTGAIKSITDFGVFVGLDGGIDGLVHLSDLSWNETGEETIRRFKKGDELQTVVLSVDAERERISLGVKQLDKDPFSNFLVRNPKGSIVHGRVIEVDAKGALVELADGVEGYLRTSEIARDRIEDVRTVLKVGDEVEAKFVGVDRKKRIPSLSIKAKESDEEAQVMEDYGSSAPTGATTLGDLIKEQMSSGRTEGVQEE